MRNILFVCSANMERSPTAEKVFRDVPGWNVKSAGTLPYANQTVTKTLLDWADEIYVMENHHIDALKFVSPNSLKKTIVLEITDAFESMSAELVGILILKMAKHAKTRLDEWVKRRFF